MDVAPANTLTPKDEAMLRDSLKRCPQATIDAALEYRATQNPDRVPVIVTGIIERFLEADLRPKLQEGADSLRFVEDLGIDSLTMMEIVMLVESTLDVSIENEELQKLRTVGDVKNYINAKLTGSDSPDTGQPVSIAEIMDVLPHAHPFLFLQEATLQNDGAQGLYKIQGDEFFLKGHFKDNPVFPASIMLESLGQLAVLYLLKSEHTDLEKPVNAGSVYFTGCEDVRCQRICKPGETLSMAIQVKRLRHPMAQFDGHILCGTDKAASVQNLTLSFDYTA